MKRNNKDYTKLFNKIVKEYEKEGITFVRTNSKRSFCYPFLNFVVMYEEMYDNADIKALFDLLHEIGHIKTRNKKMLKWEEEAKATQWAINKCKELNISIPFYIQESFEEYVMDWVIFALNHKSKNIPDLYEDTIMNW